MSFPFLVEGPTHLEEKELAPSSSQNREAGLGTDDVAVHRQNYSRIRVAHRATHTALPRRPGARRTLGALAANVRPQEQRESQPPRKHSRWRHREVEGALLRDPGGHRGGRPLGGPDPVHTGGQQASAGSWPGPAYRPPFPPGEDDSLSVLIVISGVGESCGLITLPLP